MDNYNTLYKKFQILKNKYKAMEKVSDENLDDLIVEFKRMSATKGNNSLEYEILSFLNETKINREISVIEQQINDCLESGLADYDPSKYLC